MAGSSILVQWRALARRLFDIDRRAFVPPPKVTSSLVQITPLDRPRGDITAGQLARVTAAAFGQRRKMLRSSLKSLGGDTAALIAAAGLDPSARAEDVPIEGFCRLAALADGG